MKLSFVVPCFNEEENIAAFYDACRAAFGSRGTAWEVIFVDDGSADGTWRAVRGLCEGFENVRGIRFSRNFGKEAAMLAGITESRGEYTLTIDADMQQPPAAAVRMLDFLESHSEYDAVALFQTRRSEGKAVAWCKTGFYRLANRCFGVRLRSGASDFRMMRRSVADAFLSMAEHLRFSKGMFPWLGFKTFYMPYTAAPRCGGKSSWSFFKLLRYAAVGFVSFTYLPLRAITALGAVFLLCAAAALAYMLITRGAPTPFFLLTLVMLFVGGTQLTALGVVGEYIAQISTESKKRPLYIIKERT